MRDTERIGGHDFPSRDCDTRYGLVLAPPRCYAPKNPQEQDASSTISGFREIEDPDTGGILLVPYKEK
ncbi:hypothetical protein HY449_00260 [Candidatus Pacearchaeota archaeon]|nr:hypothetical protein [Candidatus Pacearchaeota archaeon]